MYQKKLGKDYVFNRDPTETHRVRLTQKGSRDLNTCQRSVKQLSTKKKEGRTDLGLGDSTSRFR